MMKAIELKKLAILSIASSFLAACGGDDNDNDDSTYQSENVAVVKTVAPDFSGSDIQFVDFEDDYDVSSGLVPLDQSDYTVTRFGEHYYHIGRFNIDTITKYAISDPTAPIFEYSTLDTPEDPTSNPQSLTFVDENKAYLTRYGSDKVWVVNPSAESEDDFKVGELDLSAYADADANGAPEARGAVVVDGELYIIMQRLVSYSPAEEGVSAYIAVFDIETDIEIDTDPTDDSESLRGIELTTRNPLKIVYDEDVGLFVQAVGDYGSSFSGRPTGYIGGISVIDTGDYSLSLLVDDGDDEDHPYGLISNLAIVDQNSAYFVGYNSYRDTNLYHFNPATGLEIEIVEGFENIDVSALAVGPENALWVGIGDASNPRIEILDDDQEVVETVELIQNPTAITFPE